VAGGRCFTLGPAVLENVAAAGYLKGKREEYLLARDAFNGLPLWKVDCESLGTARMVSSYNVAPLASDGQRVYVCKKDRLVALDAASGQLAVQYPVKGRPERLLVLDGVLVSSAWEDREETRDAGHGVVYGAHWLSKSGEGAVEAFDARDGKLNWSLPAAAQEMLASDGTVFLLFSSGNPPTQQQIAAVDLHSGRQRWRIGPERLAPDPGLHLECVGCGVLVVIRVKARTATIHSADDGRVLWEIKDILQPNSSRLPWLPLVDGLLWSGGQKYDPRTGKVKGGPVPRLVRSVCSPPLVAGRSPFDAHFCYFYNSADRYHYVSYRAMRGACVAGEAAANGMLYIGQNCCKCIPGQVPGFVALGPCEQVLGPDDFQRPASVERGPAFGIAAEATVARPDDWPMYRCDAQRSGAARGDLPPRLKVRWQSEVARPADGPLAEAWRARLRSWLTAPVVAEGRVFVAAVDLGQVSALDAASGRVLWRAAVGARVDSPPAIYRGLCLFGANDGWVYALSTRDGKLAWRTRIAPLERRMVAFGQVESLWPAIGAVLVRDGVVYASAGRSSETDRGLAVRALEPDSGKTLWSANIGPRNEGLNDVLAEAGGAIQWRHVRIDPATGHLEGAGQRGPKCGGMEGLHDGTWTRLMKYRSGNRAFGRVKAEMYAWNDSALFGYECFVRYNARNRWCFAMLRSKTAGNSEVQAQDYTWRLVMPVDHQVEAMALAGNGLLVAGRCYGAKSLGPPGFVWLLSLANGRKLAEYALSASPAYDGLAIAQRQAYLSLEDGSVLCLGE
jgi:outer membrane protein assembly factor BamB